MPKVGSWQCKARLLTIRIVWSNLQRIQAKNILLRII